MRCIVFVVLYSIAVPSSAIWSLFATISKSGNSNFEISVEVPNKDNGNKCTVRFEATRYPRKHAWLILSESQLSERDQELRRSIWGQSDFPKEIRLKAMLSPAVDWEVSTDEKRTLYYKLTLSSELARAAYVYVDFPSETYDGGLYYSIDIGSYCID